MKTRFCKMVIENGKSPVELVAESGVPQGDPLSSYLFSLAMEPILQKVKD
jgi:hypothetical protein